MPERRALVSLAAAVAVIWLLLAIPNQLGVLTPAGMRRFPIELPLILIVLAAMPLPRLPAVIAVALTAAAAIKLVDLATEVAFLRPFNPVLDRELIPAAWHLASGSVGWPLALAAMLAGLALFALVGRVTWWATRRVARVRARPAVALLALPALLVVGLDASGAANPPGFARTTQMAWEHLRDGWRARAELARFRAEAARDPYAALPPEAILPALAGTDVLVIFVESYGRTALQNPRYALAVTEALAAAEAEMAEGGLAARSAFLRSPIVGGQSWLAHATLLSGLRIDGQGRYRALIDSPRRTLLHLAHAAGWRTAAVMPAIRFAWPEAGYFGYDRVLVAKDLGYRGPEFGWPAIPDQFTLAVAERELLEPSARPPVFAAIALISSHAPWTPLPPLLPWEEIGDGSGYRVEGEPAEAVWRDPDRVREQFRRSLEYVLRAVGGFAARRAGDPPLIVLLGDHQPASFVSEDPAGRDVPIHMIGRPEVLARIDGWGWTPGMVPAATAPVWDMEAFRDRFLDAFGPAPRLRSVAR